MMKDIFVALEIGWITLKLQSNTIEEKNYKRYMMREIEIGDTVECIKSENNDPDVKCGDIVKVTHIISAIDNTKIFIQFDTNHGIHGRRIGNFKLNIKAIRKEKLQEIYDERD